VEPPSLNAVRVERIRQIRPACDELSRLLPDNSEFTDPQRLQSVQATFMDINELLCRYRTWRFDRPDDPAGREDFLGNHNRRQWRN
jgi:hypothetical protein